MRAVVVLAPVSSSPPGGTGTHHLPAQKETRRAPRTCPGANVFSALHTHPLTRGHSHTCAHTQTPPLAGSLAGFGAELAAGPSGWPGASVVLPLPPSQGPTPETAFPAPHPKRVFPLPEPCSAGPPPPPPPAHRSGPQTSPAGGPGLPVEPGSEGTERGPLSPLGRPGERLRLLERHRRPPSRPLRPQAGGSRVPRQPSPRRQEDQGRAGREEPEPGWERW